MDFCTWLFMISYSSFVSFPSFFRIVQEKRSYRYHVIIQPPLPSGSISPAVPASVPAAGHTVILVECWKVNGILRRMPRNGISSLAWDNQCIHRDGKRPPVHIRQIVDPFGFLHMALHVNIFIHIHLFSGSGSYRYHLPPLRSLHKPSCTHTGIHFL